MFHVNGSSRIIHKEILNKFNLQKQKFVEHFLATDPKQLDADKLNTEETLNEFYMQRQRFFEVSVNYLDTVQRLCQENYVYMR